MASDLMLDFLFHRPQRNPRDKALDTVMSIEGQISRAEANTLMDLSSAVQSDQVIVEIGTYRGRSAVALALGTLQGGCRRVYAVDPHVEFRGVCGGIFGPLDQAELYENVVKAQVGQIVSVISLSSESTAKSWSLRNIGLLWIDGNHEFDAVHNDFYAWYPFVANNGIIAFHDTDVSGVDSLVKQLLAAGIVIPQGKTDTLAWFKLQDKV